MPPGTPAEPKTDPEATYALVVGVAEYPDLPGADRRGLDDNALDFARWLRARGVPARNIRLLLAPIPNRPLEDELTCSGSPSGATEIEAAQNWLENAGERGGQLLWFYWAGHGFQTRGHLHLVASAASPKRPTHFSFDDLLGFFGAQDLAGFPTQIFIADACRVVINTRYRTTQLIAPELPAKTVLEQVVFYASGEGEPAKSSESAGGGVFSGALLDCLRETDDPAWPPDMAAIRDAVLTRLEGEDVPEPALVRYQDRAGKSETPIGGAGTAAYTGPVTTELDGFAIAQWVPGALNAASGSTASIRLDVACGLERGRVRAIIADHIDADLCHDLTMVEELLHSAGEDLLAPTRRWQLIDARQPVPVGPFGDGRLSFVVKAECADPCHVDHTEPAESVRRWVRHLATAHPDADIVVQIVGRLPIDAVLTAQRVASLLQVPVRGTDWAEAVYARGKLHDVAPETDAQPSPAEVGLADVLGYLWWQADRRGLDRTPPKWPGVEPELGRLDAVTGVPGGVVASAVVDALESTPTEVSLPEIELLCAIRDFAPHWHHAVLRAHAARRTGFGRTASLTVAAVFDADLQVWLAAAAAAGRGFEPLPASGDLERWVRDAVCIGHLRREEPALAQRWCDQGVSRGVLALCQWRAKHAQPRPWSAADVVLLGWEAVLAGRRAEQVVELDVMDDTAWMSQGLWAAIAAQRVTAGTAGVLGGLPGHLTHLRAVVGLPVPDDLEMTVVNAIRQPRRVFRYVATRTRTEPMA
jgi:hypothetical protein